MIDKQVMGKHFSRSAGTYDQYARIQKEMAVELIRMVRNQNPSEILDIGCGTGFLTQMLLQTFPRARITAVDIAPGMIEEIGKKLSGANVIFRCGDIEESVITQKYDLIISNATFQWFNFIGRTINRLYKSLSHKGFFCFSTFGSKTFHELRHSYDKARSRTGVTAQGAPGQTFYSLPDLLSICRNSTGDEDSFVHGRESLHCEYFASVKEFFESVKKIGANNSNRENRITNPSLVKNMIQIYENDYKENNQVKATYHCLYVSIQPPNNV